MLLEPKCFTRRCKHLQDIKGSEEEMNEIAFCKAFPDGIPNDIAYGDNKHIRKYPGDHGIQYEPE